MADADGANTRTVPISPTGYIGCDLEWSPDGKHLAFVSAGGGIDIADIDEHGAVTDQRELELDPEWTSEVDPAWSPDGGKLAFVLRKGDEELVGVVDRDGSGYRILVPEGSTLWDLPLTGRPTAGRSSSSSDPTIRRCGRWMWLAGEQTEVRTPVQTWQRMAP